VPGSPAKYGNLSVDQGFLGEGSQIVEGRGVVMVGYPLQQGVELTVAEGFSISTNVPIVRFGLVARRVFNGRFLIDGTASPGNSGSPVYDVQARKIIGMLQGYISDTIQLFDKQQRIVGVFPTTLGWLTPSRLMRSEPRLPRHICGKT
jgi:hypothetical protein